MNIEDIRAKKLAELQARAQQQSTEEMQFAQQIAQLEAVVKTHMTKDAITRFGNIKTVDQERATQALAVMAQLIQAGRIQIVDDAALKGILERLAPEKKQFTIKRV